MKHLQGANNARGYADEQVRVLADVRLVAVRVAASEVQLQGRVRRRLRQIAPGCAILTYDNSNNNKLFTFHYSTIIYMYVFA